MQPESVSSDRGAASSRGEDSQPIIFGGCKISAPGFDQETYERALCRAMADDIEIVTDATGETIAVYRGCNGDYRVSRHSCQCPAGVHGRCCKHRALYCFVEDVRVPRLARQWAAAREAVAA